MTTAAKEPKGLHAKLAEVMAEAGRIPKNGSYTGQGQFKYVLVGDAADAIRKALGERGVSMLPGAVEVISEAEHETRSGGTMTTLTIRTTWTLTDAETGQSATIQSLGTGADSGDKASPKAQTNAMKYALLMGFLLSTGDDPEQADTSDRRRNSALDVVELQSVIERTGKLVKGDADKFTGDWFQGPAGHQIGLRLDIAKDKHIPQVLITGAIGEALFLSDTKLLGERVTVKGMLYSVSQKGYTTYYRLVVGEHPEAEFVAHADWRVPAPDEPSPDPAEPPTEAPSEPLFSDDEQAAVDAEVDRVLGVTA